MARARDKENGRLQNPRLALYNLDKEEEEQGTRSDLQARIIDLIGLTFEQFTRSVLLAQNDFSTFLKAEQGEKASLLEKLTGTELYSAISRQIFERNARAKEAFDLIQTRIQGIELLTDEEENELAHSPCRNGKGAAASRESESGATGPSRGRPFYRTADNHPPKTTKKRRPISWCTQRNC